MDIVEGSIKHYPSLPYKRFNLHLLFGWVLFFHKDAWSCDVQLYNSKRQLNLVWWMRYNTLYGMAWSLMLLGKVSASVIMRKAKRSKK